MTGGNRIITGFPSQDTVVWQNPEDESDKEYVSDYQLDMAINGNVITGQVPSYSDPTTYRTTAEMLCNTEMSDGMESIPSIIGHLINGETPGTK